jgi:hypothetical protein
MRKSNLVPVNPPLSQSLIRLGQKDNVQVQLRSTSERVENRDTVRSNDLRQDHSLSGHHVMLTTSVALIRCSIRGKRRTNLSNGARKTFSLETLAP